MTLRLVFEGIDVDALKAIAKKSERPRVEQRKEGALTETEEEKEEAARRQSPNWRDAPGREGTGIVEDEELEREAEDRETLAERAVVRTADDDEVVLKEPQPEASTVEGEEPPPPIYTRSVTLGVKDRTASQIWNWFKMRTNCTEVPRSAEDQKEFDGLSVRFRNSAADRRRVKKGVDERKANDEMLRRARGEVEKLRAEA
jgi:hypothetical protein